MALGTITLTNTYSVGGVARSFSLDYDFGDGRVVRHLLAPRGTVNIADVASLDEVSRHGPIQADIAAGKITVEVTAGSTELAGSTLATTGAPPSATIQDEELGFDAMPAEGIVGGVSTEWKVTEQAVNDATVRIEAANNPTTAFGYGANGDRHRGSGAEIDSGAFAAANASNDRYDLVSLRGSSETPALVITTGTAGATPAIPTLPANNILLAVVRIPSGSGAPTIATALIHDHRRRMGRNPGQESRTGSTAQTMALAVRIPTAKLKGVRAFLVDISANAAAGRLQWVDNPAQLGEYDVVNGRPGTGPTANAQIGNGSILRLGAAPASGDILIVDYNQ